GIHEGALHALLVRRGIAPHVGKWAIPGGFVLTDETLDHAATRELTEETGARIPSAYIEQLYTFGAVRRDPRGRVISVTHMALVDAATITPRGASDAAEAAWVPMANIPALAFDHNAIIKYALQRLRYKLEYTNVMYAAMAAKFTLSELQQAYEAVLDKPLDKRNFRKKLVSLGFVKPLQQWTQPEKGRPAQLWRFVKREPLLVKTFVTKA
ncbi:MAG: NUDIX domain-containing protein, partial [Candidatus Uhrbacteria bacterium]